MAALAAYFDESHNHEIGVYVVAGYIGYLDTFDHTLAPDWSEAIARAPRPISEFKSSDAAHCVGEFAAWDDKREVDPFYRDLVRTFCRVLTRDEIAGVAAATVYPLRLRHPAAQSLGDPGFDLSGYDSCLHFVLRSTLRVASLMFDLHAGDQNNRLSIVHDHRSEPLFAQAILRRFAYLRAELPIEKRDSVNLPVPADSKTTSALQAADLLAFETHMEVRSRISGGKRGVRRSLQELAKSGHHSATCIDIEDLAIANLMGRPALDITPKTLFASDEEWRSESQWWPRR